MINLTVISENNRTIETIRISDLVTTNSSYSNELINLDYSNYLIKISDINTNYSLPVFQSIKNDMVNDTLLLSLLFLIVLCLIIFAKYIRKL